MWERVRGKLQNGIIVSVQASAGEPLNQPEVLTAMGLSVLQGGACALRMANTETEDNIGFFKSRCPQALVIGLTKPARIPDDYKNQVYITPTYHDVQRLLRAGADVIAMDATARQRPSGESLLDIVRQIRREFPGTVLMADVATLPEGLMAEKFGFDMISTTLSGYTTETAAKEKSGPDFELLAALAKQTSVPVVMEGRLWEPREVNHAFSLGAFAVVIGSAITRPQLITRRFRDAIPEIV